MLYWQSRNQCSQVMERSYQLYERNRKLHIIKNKKQIFYSVYRTFNDHECMVLIKLLLSTHLVLKNSQLKEAVNWRVYLQLPWLKALKGTNNLIRLQNIQWLRVQGVDQIVTKYSPVAQKSQLKEADDQLTGWFAATTAESKLSELCSYLHLYIPTNWFG